MSLARTCDLLTLGRIAHVLYPRGLLLLPIIIAQIAFGEAAKVSRVVRIVGVVIGLLFVALLCLAVYVALKHS